MKKDKNKKGGWIAETAECVVLGAELIAHGVTKAVKGTVECTGEIVKCVATCVTECAGDALG